MSHTPAAIEKPSPALVTVHYGNPELTKRCLVALARHETYPHRAIVVDHGPSEGLQEALKGAHPNLTVLTNHGNPGFGPGCNLGAEAAFAEGAEAVWFLNNDAQIEDPLLEELLGLSHEHPEVAFWAHTQREGTNHLGADHQPAWYAVHQENLPPPPTGCSFLRPRESLSGASLFVTRQQWDQVGPWPSDYFLYYEDAAYCHRAHRLGKPMALLARSIVHDRGATTGRRSPLTIFYGARNRLLLHRDIHPDRGAYRLLMGLDLLQKRFFQLRWYLLKPTWDGLWAGLWNRRGRDPRY